MAKRTWATLRDLIGQELQDTSNAIYGVAELNLYMPEALIEISNYVPYIFTHTYTVESRTGTASSTTTNALVDATESQFTSADVDKVIFNYTDNTFAIVTAYVSTSQLTLSKDIMVSGESYKMFNKGCYSNREINIEDIVNYYDVISVEYPTMCNPKRFRNFTIRGNILSIDLAVSPNDTSQSNADKEVFVTFLMTHWLTQNTDVAGAVNLLAGYAAGTTTMAVDGFGTTEVIKADQEFTIASVRGVYRVTADVTMSSGGGNITFYPGLFDAAVDDDVITLTASTLRPDLETLLVDLIVAKALIHKGPKYLAQINTALTTIATANTALGLVAAQITLAIAKVALGKTEQDKADDLVTTSNTYLALVDEEVVQAIADLATGRALIGTTSVFTNPVTEYANYASAGISNARGYLENAVGYLRQANADEAVGASYGNLASRDLANAGGYLQEASGHISELMTRLQLARTGAETLQSQGERRLALVLQRLRAKSRPKIAQEWSKY